MLKFTALVYLMLMVSALSTTNLYCDSCGIECAPACGTRRFRSCCFHYLRKKSLDYDLENKIPQSNIPLFAIIDSPDWSYAFANKFGLYRHDNTVENNIEAFNDV